MFTAFSSKIMYEPLKNLQLNKPEPIILGIESSCDETAAAVIKGRKILSDEIASSANIQAKFGGVVPEIASRAHTDFIAEVVERAVKNAGITYEDIDAVAVTYGAGLLGALLVGVSFAKAFAYALNKPLIAVNHIRGHLAAAYLDCTELKPPFVTLLASGGHTAILYADSEAEFEILGATLDDAAGEAFDKIGRVIGMPYPGGAALDKLAYEGDPKAIKLPSPALQNSIDFSFSGIKTAALNYINSATQKGEEINRADLAASYTKAIVDAIVKQTAAAIDQTGLKRLVLAGGVAANSHLRSALEEMCKKKKVTFTVPSRALCGDNGAMIAVSGCFEYLAGKRADTSLNASALDEM